MAAAKSPPPLAVALLVAVGIVVIQGLLVPLYAGLGANAEPRDLPVVVAGPEPAADQFAARLAQERPGAFEVTRLDSEAAADQALRDREAYAAFVLGPSGVTLHTVSAASPVVAQLLTSAATEIGGGQPVPVRDVVPGSPDDPRGAGFTAGFLPMALTSMFVGIGLALVVRGRWVRLAGLVVYGVLAGLVAAAVLQGWLGVLGGDYLTAAAVIGLFGFATAGTVLGLGAAIGAPGIVLGALTAFLVGNPLSAVAAAPELLPQPWGLVGQWLPPGAGGTLLRSVSWFDGAGSTQPLWTLAGWAVLGVVLVLVGRATLLPASGAEDRPATEAAAPGAG